MSIPSATTTVLRSTRQIRNAPVPSSAVAPLLSGAVGPTSVTRATIPQSHADEVLHTHTQTVTHARVAAFSTTAAIAYPRKTAQDRESMDTSPTENTKSGTDDEVASQKTPFDPTTTSPETERQQAGHEAQERHGKVGDPLENPLNVSGANKDVSEARTMDEPESGVQKGPSSKRSPKKAKGIHRYQDETKKE